MNENTDKLTGCLKTDLFSGDFGGLTELADKEYGDLTLVMLDLDNLKYLNDNHGHEAGDEIFRVIGKILLELPAKDYRVYRYSGDCFALLFPDCEKEEAFLVIENARKSIAEHKVCAEYKMTVSAGIATYPEDGAREGDILRKAEGALYRAKKAGKNKIALAKEEKLVTKTAHYTVEQLKKLKELASEREISEAVLMREALDELLKKYNE